MSTRPEITAPPAIGFVFDMIVGVENHGPDDAGEIQVRNVLSPSLEVLGSDCAMVESPSGSGQWVWSIGSLAAATSGQCIIKVRVVSLTAIRNNAVVSGNDFDPLVNNNQVLFQFGGPIVSIPALGTAWQWLLAILLVVSVWGSFRRGGQFGMHGTDR